MRWLRLDGWICSAIKVNAVVSLSLGILTLNAHPPPPPFRPLVNQHNDAIAYTNLFRNQYFSVNRIDFREKRKLINYLSAWGSDRRLCLKILPSRKNEIYLWKMATKVGMYSATHESVTVARGQKQENTKKKKTNTVRATNIYEVYIRTIVMVSSVGGFYADFMCR